MSVHLYPTHAAFINGWPTAEIDVDEETAAELLGYAPPVYTTDPPGGEAAGQPTEDPAPAGSSDSAEE